MSVSAHYSFGIGRRMPQMRALNLDGKEEEKEKVWTGPTP